VSTRIMLLRLINRFIIIINVIIIYRAYNWNREMCWKKSDVGLPDALMIRRKAES